MIDATAQCVVDLDVEDESRIANCVLKAQES